MGDAPKNVRTQRSHSRRQQGTKQAEPNKSNSAKTLKVSVKPFQRLVGIQRAKPVVAPAGAKYLAHFNRASKVTVKPSKRNKSKSAMQPKNVGATDVTKVTI